MMVEVWKKNDADADADAAVKWKDTPCAA